MHRIIMLALIILLIYVILKRTIIKVQKKPKSNAIEDIVQCAHCGIYSPKCDSHFTRQQYFCSIAHSKEINKESNPP